MNKIPRYVFAAATGILILMYFLPLWSISLEAPQYPEGIGLYIWIDNITGEHKHDLANINRLNHYIGMKEIHPESIAELRIMPYIIFALIIFGIAANLLKKRIFLIIWLVIFMLIAITGLVDFYLWEYDYGHNLNPDAAIKIPGMSYQPPLIGTKQILNMRTTSLPAAGGLVAFLSIIAAMFALVLDVRQKRTDSG